IVVVVRRHHRMMRSVVGHTTSALLESSPSSDFAVEEVVKSTISMVSVQMKSASEIPRVQSNPSAAVRSLEVNEHKVVNELIDPTGKGGPLQASEETTGEQHGADPLVSPLQT